MVPVAILGTNKVIEYTKSVDGNNAYIYNITEESILVYIPIMDYRAHTHTHTHIYIYSVCI